MEPKKFPNAPFPNYGDEEEDLFDNELTVSSCSDCTGLIPSSPDTDADIKSYQDIYNIPLAKNEIDKIDKKNKKN